MVDSLKAAPPRFSVRWMEGASGRAVLAKKEDCVHTEPFQLSLFATSAACRRVDEAILSLRVRGVNWLSLFAYPISEGFQSWSLMTARFVRSILALEDKVPEAIRRQIAFRMMIVLEGICRDAMTYWRER
jgi:hypothetical protein